MFDTISYPSTLLTGKTVLVMGVANEKSLAWGIARAAHAAGASLVFTYPNDAMEKRVRPLAEQLDAEVFPCDVATDASIMALADSLSGRTIDGLVHAIAFADKEELKGGLTGTPRESFRTAMDISCYSLIALMKHLQPALAEHAGVLALSYLGGDKVVANYNVMGLAKAALESAVRYLAAEFGPADRKRIRVNAISAGPVNTLAARGIGDFGTMLRHHESTAPLRRLTTPDDVGLAALFLLSSLSQGITGEIMYVDGGANILGPTITTA